MTEPGGDLLTVTATDQGLAVSGEIDGHTAPRLAEALAARSSEEIVLDLSGVEFVDSSGLRVLIDAHQACERDGGALRMVQPSSAVARLFEISGVTEYLRVEPA